ncbi:glycerol-3-phosphate dehydrogenase (NAD(P)+) [Rhodopseudomonas rhenobacensis]|uniref:Glycerol-3-phosphate dehydrogenase [NAD(P)+] n=1 Tax=Rhodopseudomonas rhenobacensis TaxID=87461 RepID=A0A7W7Z075_9BRAD|nr:NAD(P)H-dependent glycerol-3-phosphate dehydrogenase [Rhodopseudomonas rhenobacensis]MBB5045420.1 glycerol-3-phosphate dehydrogenase (NAD(P)+) [Rhodopseudomonas rhenobacensis]
MLSYNSVAVLGGGAWGTALAQTCARAGRNVVLWEHDAGNAQQLESQRESLYLPGVTLESSIQVTRDLHDAAKAQAILLVVPAQVLRQVVTSLAPLIADRTPLVACAKGIEHGSHKFMTEIIAEAAPNATPAILSGPSFAADVARGLPTAVTIAATDAGIAQALALAMNSGTFRPYHSTDVRGVELGGATKNVLAIAAGIVEGRKLGASALAAMTTRGFAELVRFGKACGARTETMMGLSGLGDLILTCGTSQSRNFSFGVALGRGESAAEASHGKLAEGAFTAPVLLEMARLNNVEMPISAAVAAILAGQLSVDAAIEGLLTRPLKAEE